MKYSVIFSCGHTATVDLVGKCKDRERKIAYYEESGLCPCCYEAKKEAENAQGCEEVEMHYGEYKNNYADCKTKAGSYNPKTKTIIVYVPVKNEEPEQDGAAETTEPEAATTAENRTEDKAEEKTDGIRKVKKYETIRHNVQTDANGNKTVRALIGQEWELRKHGFITTDWTKKNAFRYNVCPLETWIVIPADAPRDKPEQLGYFGNLAEAESFALTL